uniref:Acetyltransferase n=1 Tax=Arundo donax TaxID=35708 RepID=A0A0A9HKH6_ARUDO
MAPPISADAMVEAASAIPAAPAIAPTKMACTVEPAPAISVVSKLAVRPGGASAVGDLKLSVSDMPMLSCHYIQKGLFFPPPGVPMASLVSSLVTALSRALDVFPAFAGRLVTLHDGSIVIRCCDAAVEFHHAVAPALSLDDFLVPDADVPTELTNGLFPMDRTVSYDGHGRPLTSFQFTVLGDGAVFVGFVANHAVVDGTSFWHFFNTWAGLCRGAPVREPDFRRNFFGDSTAVLRFPGGAGPTVTFDTDAPLRERILHFSAAAIRELKATANRWKRTGQEDAEVNGKLAHDSKVQGDRGDISSFQSLCAHIWRAVTRARRLLAADSTTTFRMAVNCRHRLRPAISALYFGNAIQSVATTATVAELASNDLGWAASRLHATVAAHQDGAIRRAAGEWEAAPRCFPLGNPDGAAMTMGSSPRFPMYDGNDFGWGRALAVRSGRANKFDGKMSAFPGQAGDGSVDVEVCLAPDTMACLLRDEEFLQYVSLHAP